MSIKPDGPASLSEELAIGLLFAACYAAFVFIVCIVIAMVFL